MNTKIFTITTFLLLSFVSIQAQDCYGTFFKQGTAAYDTLNFEEAIKKFEAAAVCSNASAAQQEKAQEWLLKSQNGFIDAIRKAQAEAEGRARAGYNAALALRVERFDPTLALRIAEYNLEKHPQDPSATTVFQEIISDTLNGFYQEKIIVPGEMVNAVAITPDTEQLILGCSNGTLYKRGRVKGSPLQAIANFEAEIMCIKVAPNGAYIVVGLESGLGVILNLEGNILSKLDEHKEAVIEVAVSRNGEYILTGSEDETAILWTGEGKYVFKMPGHDGEVAGLAFEESDSMIIVTGDSYGIINFWNLRGEKISSFEGDEDGLYAIDIKLWEGEKPYIMLGADSEQGVLRDMKGKLLRFFPGHYFEVIDVQILPQKKRFLTASADDLIWMWSIDGKVTRTFYAHDDEVTDMDVSEDEKYMISCGLDSVALLWNLDGPLKSKEGKSRRYVNKVDISADGNYVVRVTQVASRKLEYYEVKKRKWNSMSLGENTAYSLALSPEGDFLIVGMGNQNINIYSFPGLEMVASFSGVLKQSGITGIAVSPEGKYFAAGNSKEGGGIWQRDGKLLMTLGEKGDFYGLERADFSHDGKFLISSHSDRKVRVWDIEQKKMLYRLPKFSQYITEVDFAPDGKHFLVATREHETTVWSMKDGKQIAILEGHADFIKCARFSPDSRHVITGSWDKTAKLWDLAGNELQTYHGHIDMVVKVAVTDDLKNAITINWDGKVRLWQLPDTFLKEHIHSFSLQELHDAGVYLEPEDLKKVKIRD